MGLTTKRLAMIACFILLPAVALMGGVNAQQGQGYSHGNGKGRGMGHHNHGPGHKGNPVRHRIIRMGTGVPAPYKGMKNPLKSSDAHLKAGAQHYKEQCASCHGFTGEGDGPIAGSMTPKPANLAFIIDRWIATDDFLMWSIAEGGAPLQTQMPAFKDVLIETQRWQIILFMRESLGSG